MTVSAERPRLLVPGLLPADPALERYRVHPGAVTAVELDPGDVLTVIDADGRQRGELTVLAGGAEDYRALGTEADTAATVLRAMAAPGSTATPGSSGLVSSVWSAEGSIRARRGPWRCSASGRRPGRGPSSPPGGA